jgi:hypothetical protein
MAEVSCGTATCTSVGITIPGASALTVPACCSNADMNTCGLDSSFLAMFGPTFPVACQPLAQPGALDANCEDSPMTLVTGTAFKISFKGCCRAAGSCGYLLNTIGGLFPLGLGCVDSSPFLEGGTPASCGDTAVGGQGGQGGQGGASDASASGAPGAAGVAGESATGGAGATAG